jgi:hypothetical protein
MSDEGELPWLGQPMVTAPETIDSPSSTGSNSDLSSPSMSEWRAYQENFSVAQVPGLPFNPGSYPTAEVPAQCSGTHPNYCNCMSELDQYEENVAAIQGSGLPFVASSYPIPDAPAQCSGTHPTHYNCIWCNSNPDEVAYFPNLFNYAHGPVVQNSAFINSSMDPPVVHHVKSTR